MRAVVIDFETANSNSNSACALGLVFLQDGQILHRDSFLIRPPQRWFQFTSIHGIDWPAVADAPTFADHWAARILPWLERAEVLVAHNVGFDQRVLEATAEFYGLSVPTLPTECTVQLSRNVLGIKPANLNFVCTTLSIPLKHHDAESDAQASAWIYLYAKTGRKLWESKETPPVIGLSQQPVSSIQGTLGLSSESAQKKFLELLKRAKDGSLVDAEPNWYSEGFDSDPEVKKCNARNF